MKNNILFRIMRFDGISTHYDNRENALYLYFMDNETDNEIENFDKLEEKINNKEEYNFKWRSWNVKYNGKSMLIDKGFSKIEFNNFICKWMDSDFVFVIKL